MGHTKDTIFTTVRMLTHLPISKFFRFRLRITSFLAKWPLRVQLAGLKEPTRFADGNHLEISSGGNSYITQPVQHGSESYLMIEGIFYALADFDIQEAGRERSLSHMSVLMFVTDSDELEMDDPASESFRPLDYLIQVEC